MRVEKWFLLCLYVETKSGWFPVQQPSAQLSLCALLNVKTISAVWRSVSMCKHSNTSRNCDEVDFVFYDKLSTGPSFHYANHSDAPLQKNKHLNHYLRFDQSDSNGSQIAMIS